ncbi:MAG TPA: phospho-N-acetylmuramoyl-pentapeptide-transferase [Candidatus Gastranaerophilales bacterium]|nr:phospho-N-acetylmuramoyl-pentapeptide-transferase [Candidatus Gastranaerophilales bacterium]
MLIYISGLLGLLLTLLAGVPYLDFLKKKLYGQYIREEGPASHAAKSGTPTTGGIILIIPAAFSALLLIIMHQSLGIKTLVIILTALLFMGLGFNDDYLKITKKQNKGISAKRKLIFQCLIALIPALYIYFYGSAAVSIFGLAKIDLGLLYPLFAVFIIVGSSNAVNLTDGLDGLAAGTSFFAFLACAFICYFKGINNLAIISSAFAGSCLGFLYYNKNPAQMFMGDTGSVALGGTLGVLAVVGKFELWLLIIGAVFVIETLSVIIQVISFKSTGKRVFKMSPIHHHFELCGWSEPKVVYTFWLAGFLFATLAVWLF